MVSPGLIPTQDDQGKRMSSEAVDRFNRRCGAAGLLILFAMVILNGLMRPKFNDFPQYYMGGLMALRGEWESLYPDPYPGATDNAGNVAASRMRPRYAELAASAGVGDGNRYFHPPPVAILLAPLALFPYDVAHVVWQLILLLAGWRVAVWAGRFYAEQHGASRMAGWVTLLVAVSPLLYRCVRSSNLSSLVALFLAWIVWDLWRGKTLWGAAGMVLGVLFKYQPAVLVPLLLVTRRYRTLGVSAAAGIAVVAIGLIVGGVSPYQRYLFEILPTMRWTMPLWNNQVLSAFLLQVLDEPVLSSPVQTGIRAGSLLLMAGILALIWRARGVVRLDFGALCAACCALVTWFVIASPLFWAHYYILFAPFAGWIWSEGRAGPSWRILSLFILASFWFPLSLIHLFPIPLLLRFHTFAAALALHALAIRRLIVCLRTKPKPAEAA